MRCLVRLSPAAPPVPAIILRDVAGYKSRPLEPKVVRLNCLAYPQVSISTSQPSVPGEIVGRKSNTCAGCGAIPRRYRSPPPDRTFPTWSLQATMSYGPQNC